MTREQVYQRVVELIQDEKGEDFQVQPESTLADNIAADSVEIMEFVLNLEDEFHVDVPDAVIEHFEVLSDIVDFIYEEVKKRS
ncbi:TPA: acyl carrier protein [Streptococcus suis]|nr:acyl carrier protein [Streptococcus suis]HEM5058544.1 acyl carrier protein [Streptococcus suis]HEM5068946.1 acyl carrier protein [Streptococcus suis]HEM5165575.1 acyl carrier protein [Streptococcus suis]HEM5288556.1 acyl carrier protein [Streptococcus suis]